MDMNEFTPVVPEYPRFVFDIGYLKVTASVHASGDPVQVSESPVPFAGPVKLIPAVGQLETVTVSLIALELQALLVVLCVCVGEANFGVLADVPLPLAKPVT
jgi:hypothetical protein